MFESRRDVGTFEFIHEDRAQIRVKEAINILWGRKEEFMIEKMVENFEK